MSKIRKPKISTVAFRLTPEEVIRLDKVCEASGLSRSAFFREVLNVQYDKINGNPKLKQALEKVKLASEIFGDFSFLE